jgi:hypothetical protein
MEPNKKSAHAQYYVLENIKIVEDIVQERQKALHPSAGSGLCTRCEPHTLVTR